MFGLQVPTVFTLNLVTMNKHLKCEMIHIKGWVCVLIFIVENLLFSLWNASSPDLRWDHSTAKSFDRMKGETWSMTDIANLMATWKKQTLKVGWQPCSRATTLKKFKCIWKYFYFLFVGVFVYISWRKWFPKALWSVSPQFATENSVRGLLWSPKFGQSFYMCLYQYRWHSIVSNQNNLLLVFFRSQGWDLNNNSTGDIGYFSF